MFVLKPDFQALWRAAVENNQALRASLARAEAAAKIMAANAEAQRDAAIAERDAARAQIRLLAKLVERAFHNLPHCYNSWRDEARDALASITKEPTDGE